MVLPTGSAFQFSTTIVQSYNRTIKISESSGTEEPTESSETEEPTEPEGFELVDNDGNIIEDASGILGLLTYNGGTVCDDDFGGSEADVICQEMGYDRSSGWTSGSFYEDVQSSLNITLDNVDCYWGSWSSCDYLTEHDCGHSEDVFLTCVTGETIKLGPYQLSITPLRLRKICKL